MKFFKRLIFVLVVLYLIALVFVFVKQRSFIYFPENRSPPAEFVSAFNLEIAEVEVEDIGIVRSFFKSAPEGSKTVLFFHGNGGSVYHRTALFKKFDEWDLGYFAVEYPGYADNQGTPTERSILTSANAHYDWLVARGVRPDNIVIYGHSLGAASAVHVASERDATALVLTAPFLSAKAMGRHRMPYFPTDMLLKDKFRSDLKMALVEEPMVILHGNTDLVIPHHMGEALAALHSGEHEFVTIPGAGHMITVDIMETYLKTAVFKHIADIQ